MSSEPSPGVDAEGRVVPAKPAAGDPVALMAEHLTALMAEQRVSPYEPVMEQAAAANMTAEHVTQLLQLATLRETNRSAEAINRATIRPKFTAVIVISVLVFLAVVVISALGFNRPEIVTPVITGLTGALGGFGLGRATKSKDAPSP